MKNYLRLILVVLVLFTFAGTNHMQARTTESNYPNGFAQSAKKTCEGIVLDQKGEAIIGATVQVKGTTNGTQTDLDGKFMLDNVPNGAVLLVKFMGYKDHEVVWKGTPLTIKMVEEAKQLDEVVVVGYGTKTKKSLTSSIASVNSEQLQNIAATSNSLDNMLGGMLKGVLMYQTSGEPGATPVINVRGITSPYTPTNSPLYVIDGIPFFLEGNAINPLMSISPNDIETIDVLKDASATAIYGSRGSNGVIIVNTKKGRRGERISSDFSYNVSTGTPINSYKMLDTQRFINLQDMIMRNTIEAYKQGRSYADINLMSSIANITIDPNTMMPTYNGLKKEAFGTNNIDWQKEIRRRHAITHQYAYSMSGGSDKTDFMISLNATNQDGLFINDHLDRYSSRININSYVSSRLMVGAMLNYAYTYRKSTDGSQDEMPAYPWTYRPDLPIYDENGEFKRGDGTIIWGLPATVPNPLAVRQKRNDYKSNQVIGNAYAELTLLDGLKGRVDFNFSNDQFENKFLAPLVAIDQIEGYNILSNLQYFKTSTTNLALNFRLNYDKMIGCHFVSAMLGYGGDRTNGDMVSAFYEGFPDDRLMTIETALQNRGYGSGHNISALNSIYSRFSYSYMNKYLSEVAFRADKSSKFGPNHKWGLFPAVSLGWRFSEEGLVKDHLSFINDGKLRMSYGRSGSTNVSDFSYRQYFTTSPQTSYMGKFGTVIKQTLPNPDIRWEMTSEYNSGIDFSLFNNFLFGNIDVYYRYTSGAISSGTHTLESGLKDFSSNEIDISNKGFEFQIGMNLIQTDEFAWTTSFNISGNRNKVERLNGADISPFMIEAFTLGQPIGGIKGFEVEKIASTQEEIDQLNKKAIEKGYDGYIDGGLAVGDYILKDVNQDGHIDRNDRVIIANSQPKFFGGWTNTIRYKSFTLNALFQFSQEGKALLSSWRSGLAGSLLYNLPEYIYNDLWSKENPNGRYQSLIYYANSPYRDADNDRSVFSTSYMRLKNISLQYDMPESITSKLYLNAMSIILSGNNLFTITKWPGIDPELLGSFSTTMSSSSDPYPLSKSYSLGVRLTF